MERFLKKLGTFIVNRRLYVLITCLLLIVPCIFGILRLGIATGTETFVSTNTQTYKEFDRFNQHFGSSVIAVLVTGDDLDQLLQPGNIAAMDSVEDRLRVNDNVISALGPVFVMELVSIQQNGTALLPQEPAQLRALLYDPDTGQIRPQLESVFPDESHALIAITLAGGLQPGEEKAVIEEAREAVEAADFDGVEVLVSGSTAITSQIEDLMGSSMLYMFIIAVVLMLLILALVFSVRGFFTWRWLPLCVVALGLIYTFGIVGVLSIPITMVTMTVFPVLVGLGVDYGIQLHKRYDEEVVKGRDTVNAVMESVTRVGPAIGIALLAACLGFAALFFSPVPMIRQFGGMLIVGVIACYLLSVFFLLPILHIHARRVASMAPADKVRYAIRRDYEIVALLAAFFGTAASLLLLIPSVREFGFMVGFLVIACFVVSLVTLWIYLRGRDRPTKQTLSDSESKDKPARGLLILMARGFCRLSPWVIKHPAVILPIALILTAAGLAADSHIATETDETKFISQNVPVMRDFQTLVEVVGGISPANLLVEGEDVTDPAVLEWMLQLEHRIAGEEGATFSGTNSIASVLLELTRTLDIEMPQTSEEARQLLNVLPEQIRVNLVNDDYTAANLIVNARGSGIDQIREVKEQLTGYIDDHPGEVDVAVTGTLVMQIELFNALTSGRIKMTLIGIGFIFLGLFLLFRFNVLRALLCSLPIVLIIGWSGGLLYLTGVKYTPLTATLGALIMGIGMEFTILLMMRYDEERKKGEEPVEAMTTAMTNIGPAIVASGFTTIGGFAALLGALDFVILRDFGIVTMINVFFAMVSTLLVLPALIVLGESWWGKSRLARFTLSIPVYRLIKLKRSSEEDRLTNMR